MGEKIKTKEYSFLREEIMQRMNWHQEHTKKIVFKYKFNFADKIRQEWSAL